MKPFDLKVATRAAPGSDLFLDNISVALEVLAILKTNLIRERSDLSYEVLRCFRRPNTA
jgi:hypothetical protein